MELQIDAVARKSFNIGMGPFALMNLMAHQLPSIRQIILLNNSTLQGTKVHKIFVIC